MTNKIAVYPGSFDPITYGHIDLAERACNLFDKVIIGIFEMGSKNLLLSAEKRAMIAREVLQNCHNIEVKIFSTLLVEFAKQEGATCLVRGLRAISDFEYEFQLAGMNRRLNPKIETIFMTPAEQHANISSTLVKEIFLLNGDVSNFTPPYVAKFLKENVGAK